MAPKAKQQGKAVLELAKSWMEGISSAVEGDPVEDESMAAGGGDGDKENSWGHAYDFDAVHVGFLNVDRLLFDGGLQWQCNNRCVCGAVCLGVYSWLLEMLQVVCSGLAQSMTMFQVGFEQFRAVSSSFQQFRVDCVGTALSSGIEDIKKRPATAHDVLKRPGSKFLKSVMKKPSSAAGEGDDNPTEEDNEGEKSKDKLKAMFVKRTAWAFINGHLGKR
eukprot:12139836-Alexandrium_andersonii.AAC.1